MRGGAGTSSGEGHDNGLLALAPAGGGGREVSWRTIRAVAPVIELFWWQGCPSWGRALEMLREEMRAAGIGEERLRVTEVGNEEEAIRHRFPGSPTIRVNGRDVQPLAAGSPIGLTCRVYRRRDGRVSPLPDREDVREALRGGLEE